MRNLLILILVLILYWWASRALARRSVERKHAARRSWFSKKKAETPPERMLACRHCGLHLPESEGIHDHDGFYCCEDHRRLGVKR